MEAVFARLCKILYIGVVDIDPSAISGRKMTSLRCRTSMTSPASNHKLTRNHATAQID